MLDRPSRDPLGTLLQVLYYCARKFRRENPGTDIIKVLEAFERIVIELEEQRARDSGTAGAWN